MIRKEKVPELKILNCLFRQSGDYSVAHCLDLDLVATGRDHAQANERMNALIKLHVESSLRSGNYDNLTTKAPSHFWDEYAQGTPLDLLPARVEIELPEVVPMDNPESRLAVLRRQIVHVATR